MVFQNNKLKELKNAISTELNGSVTEITAFVLGELLIQKNFNENEIEKMVSMFKRTTKALTDSSNLEFEWNDKLEKEFFYNLSELLAITQSNPLMRSEMQEIVNKYSQRIEKVRALIEKKNQAKDS